MRFVEKSAVLKARAIAGTHVVVLAWDFLPSQQSRRKGLLGFGIERSELDDAAHPIEKYWMRSIKRFRDKDKSLAPGTPVPTSDHPIQSFQWGDYTAKSSKHYLYTVVPMYGKPKLLEADHAAAVTLDVWTEPDTAPEDSGPVRHDVYFNRGVIGSQAYAREFGNRAPRAENPFSPEMVWLSHGLFEGLTDFIGLAGDGDALRAAVYEFHYQPVANAFAAAIEAGVDVKIVYDDESDYAAENEETIEKARLNEMDAVIARTVSEGIRHNKFIVLLRKKKPVAVWTGSTNISDGGIFGHSNVGHVVWDTGVAQAYLDYWDRLAENLTPTKLRPLNRKASPTPKGKPKKNSVTPLFSARDEKDSNDTLQWYADLMSEAKEMVCFTVAFNLDPVFQAVLSRENDVLRYIVKDDPLSKDEIIGHDRDVLFAAGAYFGEDALANFLGERDNPLNSNNYIHTKFMLVDPLSDDPIVVTGSANFSLPSQRINDENMLVIRGDRRVADIYFGEYMRIFDHHYARYLVRKLAQEEKSDPNAGYLKEAWDEWVPGHFAADSYKAKRRKYFVGT